MVVVGREAAMSSSLRSIRSVSRYMLLELAAGEIQKDEVSFCQLHHAYLFHNVSRGVLAVEMSALVRRGCAHLGRS